MARICGVTALFALPWHLYQLLVHRKWFLAEYFGVQLFAFGGAATPQTSAESQIAFYVRRLFLTDPVLPALIAAEPHADFMMPEIVFASLDRSKAAASRKVWEPGFGQVFLLAVR